MYEKLHILSPLLEATDYYFIHYFRKLDEKTWIMVDVSYDLIKEIQSGETSHAWKFPSGCAIQDLEHGESRVSNFPIYICINIKKFYCTQFYTQIFGRDCFTIQINDIYVYVCVCNLFLSISSRKKLTCTDTYLIMFIFINII